MNNIISYEEMLSKQMNYVWKQGFKLGLAFGMTIAILICILIL